MDGTGLSDATDWVVDPVPTRRLFGPEGVQVVRSGAVLSLVIAGVDEFGNATAPTLLWSIEPAFDLLVRDDGTLTLSGSGRTLLTATDAESAATVDVAVGVDATPPRIRVTAPTVGAFADSRGPLRVEGEVVDDVGVASVLVVGEEATLDAQGRFGVEVGAPLVGLEVVDVEATDLADRRSAAVRAALYGQFGRPDALRDDALRLGVNPLVLDDDDPDLDDLASLAELALSPDGRGADFFTTECGGGSDMTNLAYDPPRVDIWPEEGGLGVRVTASNVRIDYTGQGCADVLGCTCHYFDDTLRAERVTVEADASLLVALCGVESDTVAQPAVVEGLDLNLPAEERQYEGLVRASAEQVVADTATGLLLEVVEGAIDHGLSNARLAPGGLVAQACVVAAVFDEGGGHLDAPGQVDRADPARAAGAGAGVLITAGGAPDMRSPDDAMVYAVDDDLVNAIFYEAWMAGDVDAALPAVLMTGGEGGPDLAYGDVPVEVPTEAGPAAASVTIRASAQVQAAADGVLTIGPSPQAEPGDVRVYVDVVEAPPGGPRRHPDGGRAHRP